MSDKYIKNISSKKKNNNNYNNNKNNNKLIKLNKILTNESFAKNFRPLF
jgi:hypothetical protein